jgi:hypothetical protein
MPSEPSSNSIPSSYRNPILYIEESIKRVRGDNKARRHNKYDTDWRIYIAYRYGKYMFCGTRQPVPLADKKKENPATETGPVQPRTWPAISLSFDYSSEICSYVKSLIGNSKVNITLYISETTGTALDDLFVHPSHENFDVLDAERSNRRMELVGYDRIKTFSNDVVDTNIVKQMLSSLVSMGYSQTGMRLSFTCSPPPLADIADTVLAPLPEPEPTLEYQPATEPSDAVYSHNTSDAHYDDEYDYVYSGGTGSYTQTYDYHN